MTTAGQWYETESLWAAASVGVAIAALVAGAWATLRAAYPKRCLTYDLVTLTPLISPSSLLRGGLSVSLNGAALTDPHVLKIRLLNSGVRDIPSDAFDNGVPIRIDLGARVISVLDSTSEPSHAVPPSLNVDGQCITIGPTLIAKKQQITVSALVDGPQPRLTIRAALIEVDVRRYRPELPIPGFMPVALAVLGAIVALSGNGRSRFVVGASVGLGLASVLLVAQKLITHFNRRYWGDGSVRGATSNL
ncbi:hypothetical protein [Streptomyces sp. AC555_RSS877]|uniref:hypothetical protein n=1 Tax=Streptomyces sp. AC555_RSS877 TaxID=2823688 RepID=UPI001C2629EE|nr:hypothetical protein [Streptomyces sp. AC555_RSS877]